MSDASLFEEKSVFKVLLRIAPPVMLAQLIQALYNIVDSFFVGRFSEHGLTALSVIFPIQLIITALAVGTGVGVNTLMSKFYALRKTEDAHMAAGIGTLLSIVSWLLFSVISSAVMRPYVTVSVQSDLAAEYSVSYGTIVCVGSIGLFLEGIWTKVHQASGNMRRPMVAQIIGAVVNIILDPILIFGMGPIPSLGVSGAAIATVIGQVMAAVITFSGGFYPVPSLKKALGFIKQIYRLGYPSILMQSLYTVYIVVLNLILAGFCDQAVTVLGLYYKLQTFFFIPLFGLQTSIVPYLSYTFTRLDYSRCKKILFESTLLAMAFMLIGVFGFEFFPTQLLSVFSSDPLVFEIGETAFRIIGLSFVPAAVSLMMPIFFQAIGAGIQSITLSLARQIFCLIPLFWAFSRIGLNYSWLAFPVSETVVGLLGLVLYFFYVRGWKTAEQKPKPNASE